jgi:GDP-mannose 6-dehydrogenase
MAACLARLGHEVVGIDINPAKAEALNQGGSLIVEPGLEQITAAEHSAGKLRGTTDPTEAVRQSDLSFVCVGTPSLRAGRLGLQSIERVKNSELRWRPRMDGIQSRYEALYSQAPSSL